MLPKITKFFQIILSVVYQLQMYEAILVKTSYSSGSDVKIPLVTTYLLSGGVFHKFLESTHKFIFVETI